jgi:predicted short-subunit dehydrogenase-like oxidoreductase (DUF2520 family)
MNINLVGAGQVGKTLAHLFVKHQLAQIQAVFNTHSKRAESAIAWIGGGHYCATLEDLPHADITLITTPDDYIEQTCQILSKSLQIKPGDIILHCSGALSSDALISAKKRGCFVASIHPMRSFANLTQSAQEYPGTYCAMEGDMEALQVLEPLFKAIGSVTYPIEQSKKIVYHAGAVFASNYLVTLAKQSIDCFTSAGMEREFAKDVALTMMRSVFENIQNHSLETALTGPIKRGDINTIQKHIDHLPEAERNVYQALGYATLPLTCHDLETLNKLQNMTLSEPENNHD